MTGARSIYSRSKIELAQDVLFFLTGGANVEADMHGIRHRLLRLAWQKGRVTTRQSLVLETAEL